jgi:hypothetical protein
MSCAKTINERIEKAVTKYNNFTISMSKKHRGGQDCDCLTYKWKLFSLWMDILCEYKEQECIATRVITTEQPGLVSSFSVPSTILDNKGFFILYSSEGVSLGGSVSIDWWEYENITNALSAITHVTWTYNVVGSNVIFSTTEYFSPLYEIVFNDSFVTYPFSITQTGFPDIITTEEYTVSKYTNCCTSEETVKVILNNIEKL